MGLISNIRGAMDSARAAKIERANAAAEGGGGRGRGRHRAPLGGVQCNYHWTEKGGYPHEEHRCGDAPHNRGDHHCIQGWNCTATTPYRA